jgi:hypothetical protein
MKKLSKMGVVLFGGAMAVCAIAMPSMTSAASWGPVGTEHTLDAPNFGFSTTVPGLGAVTSSCSRSTLTGVPGIRSIMTLTAASFTGCTATGPNIGSCTAVTTATLGSDPRVMALTTSDIQINSVVLDMTFQNHAGSRACLTVVGVSTTVTGALGGGQWSGNGANQHEVIYNDDEGFVMHTPVGTVPVTTRGTFRDTQQTLTLT